MLCLPPVLTLLVSGLGALALAEPDVPQVAMPLMKTVPTVDGVIDEEEWRHAVRNVGFVGHQSGSLSARRGVFWLGSPMIPQSCGLPVEQSTREKRQPTVLQTRPSASSIGKSPRSR